MKLKKICSVALVVLILILQCSFSVFAADDGGQELDLSAFNLEMVRECVSGDAFDLDFSDTAVSGTEVYRGVPMNWYHNDNPLFYSRGEDPLMAEKCTIVSGPLDLRSDHEYNLKLKHAVNFNGRYRIRVYIRIISNNSYRDDSIYDIEFSSSQVNSTDFNFFLRREDVGTNFKAQLVIEHAINPAFGYGVGGENVKQYISNPVLTDLDDDSGWFQKIINAITSIPSKISGFFSDLATKIGGFFTDLSDKIRGFFTDLGNKIGDFFTMLKNYILYFRHPVTLNSSGVPIGSDGKPIYINPFDSPLETVKKTFDGWIATLMNFVASIDSSSATVSGYLKKGSTVIDGVLGAVPLLSAFVLFAVIFLVIRKVVGR